MATMGGLGLAVVVNPIIGLTLAGLSQTLTSSSLGRLHRARKRGINFILKPIDNLDHRCAGKMFNFNFVCIALVQNS